MATAGTLSIGPDGHNTADTLGAGRAGNVEVNVTGGLTIDGTSATGPVTGITALPVPLNSGITGNAGDITIAAGSLSIGPNGQITTDTFGAGKGGDITVTVAGALLIDRTSSTVPTGITALTDSSGSAGNITIATGSLAQPGVFTDSPQRSCAAARVRCWPRPLRRRSPSFWQSMPI